MKYHESVLLDEVIEALDVKPGAKYIDATLGGGGHTKAILERGGLVLGIDFDEDALKHASSTIKNSNLTLARGNFVNIDEIAKENGFVGAAGIIFDLGVSSYQIDTPERGFSYLGSSPLDMRMDQRLGVKASDLLNVLNRNELMSIFRDLGEERMAAKIADAILDQRKIKQFEKTDELANLLVRVYGFREFSDFAKANSSKKVFQALRMRVNDERRNIEEALPRALWVLDKGGRMEVITFHSLEDRVVKNAFRKFEQEGQARFLYKKPIMAGAEEVKRNSRSKSAKLRAIEKI